MSEIAQKSPVSKNRAKSSGGQTNYGASEANALIQRQSSELQSFLHPGSPSPLTHYEGAFTFQLNSTQSLKQNSNEQLLHLEDASPLRTPEKPNSHLKFYRSSSKHFGKGDSIAKSQSTTVIQRFDAPYSANKEAIEHQIDPEYLRNLIVADELNPKAYAIPLRKLVNKRNYIIRESGGARSKSVELITEHEQKIDEKLEELQSLNRVSNHGLQRFDFGARTNIEKEQEAIKKRLTIRNLNSDVSKKHHPMFLDQSERNAFNQFLRKVTSSLEANTEAGSPLTQKFVIQDLQSASQSPSNINVSSPKTPFKLHSRQNSVELEAFSPMLRSAGVSPSNFAKGSGVNSKFLGVTDQKNTKMKLSSNDPSIVNYHVANLKLSNNSTTNMRLTHTGFRNSSKPSTPICKMPLRKSSLDALSTILQKTKTNSENVSQIPKQKFSGSSVLRGKSLNSSKV